MTDIIIRALFIGVFTAFAVELIVSCGAWDRLAAWWRRHNEWHLDERDELESPLWRTKR